MRTGFAGGVVGHCILAALAGTGAAPAESPARLEPHQFESKHMGAAFALTVYAADKPAAEAAAKAAFARVAAVEKALSDYDPQSEVMRVCRKNDAAPGVPIPVGPDLFACLTESVRVAKLTGGKFDPTVGPLTKLWRLTRRTQQMPAAADLAAARAVVGYDKLALDPAAKTVTFAVPGVSLDFGGIGKGFAADEVLKLLCTGHAMPHALIAAGGDVTCGDAPPGAAGWAVDVKPLAAGRPARRLTLTNQSVSTSGDLDQVALVGGVRYSHVLDPTTGLGLTGRRSVTVVANTGALADSLTKAASVLPAAAALKLVHGVDGAALYAVVRDPEAAPEVVTESPRFAPLVAK